MRKTFVLYPFSLLLVAGAALAQTPGEYSLDAGFIKFSAPPAWPVIMQKNEGDPQFVAFQVKDPADSGSGEATRVTVETRLLNNSSNFQALVNRDVDKAKQMPDYQQHMDGIDASVLRYSARNGNTPYEYRETWYLNGHLIVHVRCARPLLAKTAPQWTTDYNAGCAQIMQSLKPH
ncbi:MAG: hypothetical protein ACREPN_11035 [Rudaea sp.]